MSRSITVLLASAGTGKTYRLTLHFLGLLLTGVDPSRVLATTFTRKAAGEILGRVLGRLAEAAARPEDHDDGAAALARGLRAAGCPVPEELDRAACRAALVRLVDELHRFQVRTIDSWFGSLARAFGAELGLPAEWRIAADVEDATLRSEALGLLLGEGRPEDAGRLLRDLQRTEGSARVHDGLLDIVRRARDVMADSTPEAWDAIQAGPELDEAALEAAVVAFERMELPTTKAGKPNGNWRKAVDKATAQARAGDWEGFLKGGLASKLLEAEYYNLPMTDDHMACLLPLVQHAAAVLVGRVVRQNEATRDLVPRFEGHLDRLRARVGLYGFSDVTRVLSPTGGEALADFDLDYRLDGRVDHLLLDEFQDTNVQQYRVLARLLEEITAEQEGPRSLFCVGDVKQSIYGFRRAEPRLLESLSGRLGVEAETMVASWRSSHVVLDTVNRVFAGLHARDPFDGDEADLAEAAAHWTSLFERHRVPETRKAIPGAAVLLQAEPHDPERGKPLDAVVRLAVRRAAELHREAPDATIAILLRRRRYLPAILRQLGELDVPASGEGGVPLVDAAEVRAASALLHLADHPGDTLAALVVARSPFGSALGIAPEDLAGGDRAASVAAASRASARVRTRLQGEGLGALLADLEAHVEDPFGRRRFARLVEEAHAWEARVGLRTREFVEHLETLEVEDASAARVRVLTIHASKGLEFDAVLLPELAGALFGNNGRRDYLIRRDDPTEPLSAVSVSSKKLVYQHAPELEKLEHETRERDLVDVLCVLYVAMTRAKRRLELLVPSPTDVHGADVKEARTGYAAILRAALGGDGAGAGTASGGEVLWSHEDNVEAWGPEPAEEPATVPPRAPAALDLRSGTRPRSLPTRSPSGQEGGARRRVGDLLRAPDRAATRLGTAVHRVLEEVEWLDGEPGFDLAAERPRLSGLLEGTAAERDAALDLVAEALERDAVRAVLTRGDRTGIEVWRERAFSLLLPDAEGRSELWNGAFDRVELVRDGDRVTAATVIDWKSDAVEDDARLAERVDHYRPQVRAYRRALGRLTGFEPEAIGVRLVFLRTGRVVEVET